MQQQEQLQSEDIIRAVASYLDHAYEIDPVKLFPDQSIFGITFATYALAIATESLRMNLSSKYQTEATQLISELLILTEFNTDQQNPVYNFAPGYEKASAKLRAIPLEDNKRIAKMSKLWDRIATAVLSDEEFSRFKSFISDPNLPLYRSVMNVALIKAAMNYPNEELTEKDIFSSAMFSQTLNNTRITGSLKAQIAINFVPTIFPNGINTLLEAAVYNKILVIINNNPLIISQQTGSFVELVKLIKKHNLDPDEKTNKALVEELKKPLI